MCMNWQRMRQGTGRTSLCASITALFLSYVVCLFGMSQVEAQTILSPVADKNAWQEVENAWKEAWQFEEEDQAQAAFLKYLTLSGGEGAAVRIARPLAKEFLVLLREQGESIPAQRRLLVEADLLLVLQDKAGALAAYQGVAAMFAKASQPGGEPGRLPRDEYFVEPLGSGDIEGGSFWGRRDFPVRYFSMGPGSHRDNWLIRRFIALEAWDDARREFDRVWQLHQAAIQPHVVRLMTYDDQGRQNGIRKHIVQPTGFNGQGLRFALDFAFFLQRRNDPDTARHVLLEALLRIDMDRNPNQMNYGQPVPESEGRGLPERSAQGWGFDLGSAGLSRSEFIRLSYGAIKTYGQEAELVKQLTNRVEAGENRLRRVLAQVRWQQGQADAARQLELDYIAVARFDAVSTAFRRATVFDANLKPQDAVREFEAVLALLPAEESKSTGLNLPDALEPESAERGAGVSAHHVMIMRHNHTHPSSALRTTVLTQLERLYTGLGLIDQSLDMVRQLALAPSGAGPIQTFEELHRKHRAAKQSEKLLDWARLQLDDNQDHQMRANLFWLLGDFKSSAASLAKAELPNYEMAGWKDRFRAAGAEHFRELLQALIAAHPRDSQSQLELLDLDGVIDGPQLVDRLELLLETDAAWAFQRGRGARNQTQFKDYFELAYRLMRIYERAGQFDKIHALGVRIAKGEKPFGAVNSAQYEYRNANGLPERANATLAIAIQHADTEDQIDALKAALENSVWEGARAQLRRRIDPGKSDPLAEFGWANLPAGMQLVASTENVLALAQDDRHVYSGHPWGVAVHDQTGHPVTRIALGEAARSLVVLNQHVWVGTPKGLFRISPTDWSVAHQWLHDDVDVKERHANRSPGPADYWFDNGVYTLTADRDDLWIGLHRNVQRLNTRTLELQAYSYDELQIDSWAGFDHFVLDDRYVWASSPHESLRRYDRVTDEWSAPQPVAPREPVRFVGIIGDRVFGNVYVDDQLRNRLCLIDRKSLALQTIPIVTKKGQELINSRFEFFGKHGDQLVFGTGWPAFVLDEATLTLRPITRVVEKFSERLQVKPGADKTHNSIAGAFGALNSQDEFQATFGRPHAGDWQSLTLPNGTQVLGSRQGRLRYEYPHEDGPGTVASAQFEIQEHEGGLFFVKPRVHGAAPEIRRVSAEPRANSIRGDLVRTIVFGSEHSWLCTSLGVARLDREGHVERLFTRQDGLCANRVTGGAEWLGKVYFSTAWGDSGGGLAVFDPTTSVFTSITQEDGLPTDKLDNVQVDGEQLRLTFGMQYLRHNSSSSGELRYQLFPLIAFDPKANRPGPIVKPRLMKQNEADELSQGAGWTPVPFLGGSLAQRLKHDGKIYWCGTRGVVISDKDVVAPTFAPLGAQQVLTLTARQLADAKQRAVSVVTPGDLAGALSDENPFYRANAIASMHSSANRPYSPEFLPLLASQLEEKNTRLRATAFYVVCEFSDDQQVMPLLRARQADAHPQIRGLAILNLVQRGHVPDTQPLQELLNADHGNYPFGATSSVGVQSGANALHQAIAPHATPAVFEWLLKQPPRLDDYENAEKVFPQLAAALQRNPQSVDVLLKARDAERHDQRQRDFARDVFRFAGAVMLPRLHAALKSEDRVVRSNAARACGAIQDASSITPLIQAVDLESGLSRASIVWAIGELKAEAALPVLASLYAEAKADEKRSNGSRFGQQAAAMTAQYDRISNLESLASEWNDLQAATLTPLIDPERQEELLQPQDILDAVAKIGPQLSQEFYRALAASQDTDARQEAAEQLSAASPADRDKNIVVMKSLLTDSDSGVRVPAAVGLILLDDISGQEVIQEALNSTKEWDRRQTLHQLSRLPHPAQRSFCLPRLREIAKNPVESEYIRGKASDLLP